MRKSAAWINGLLVETEDSYIRENPGTLEPLEKVFLCSKKDKRKKRSERNNNTLWDFDISVPPS